MGDENLVTSAICGPTGSCNHVEQPPRAEHGINSRSRYLPQNGNSLRCELFYQDIYVRIAHKTAANEPLFDIFLRSFRG